YIPLGGIRVTSKYRLFFNLWIVFLLSGLWHGASWNFIIWGAFHGMFLILDKIFLLRVFVNIGGIVSMIIIILMTMMGWIIFRLEDFQLLKTYLAQLFTFDSLYIPQSIPSFYPILGVAIFFSFIAYSDFGKRIEKYVFHSERFSLNINIANTLISMVLI